MPDRPHADASESLADAALRARRGAPDALATLYHAFADQLFGTAYRILGNRADAEDVLQDVFLGLPEALARYQEEGRLGAWLRRLAARTALMRLRRLRTEAAFGAGLAPPDAAPAPAGVVERLAVAEALDRMPETLRQVFLLKEIEGFTHAEVASLLGITAAASGVRLHRAWIHLRQQLGEGETR